MELKIVHVVVLGGGFAGLAFCKALRHPRVRITLIDRQNHHLFQPLLYQVATAGLSAPEIAHPIRSIFSNRSDITVLMDEVTDVRLLDKKVVLRKEEIHFDYLLIALGGTTNYFANPQWEAVAPGLKSLDDALKIRQQILTSFEKAETSLDPVERRSLMTIIIVGGGPTGVEMAGACVELARFVLKSDFRKIDPAKARIILVEASEVVLSNFPPPLGEEATEALRSMGVEVRTKMKVRQIQPGEVEFDNGERVRVATVIWTAGVGANPITRKLGVELDRAGRIKVLPDLSLPGFPNVFAAGDLALAIQESGQPVPGVSPAAIQMARHAAAIIEMELTGDAVPPADRPRFHYWDKGTMATIGRSAAVAQIGKLQLTGMAAWIAWLAVHLLFLIGFRSKVVVLFQWIYSYFTYRRGARIIVSHRDV